MTDYLRRQVTALRVTTRSTPSETACPYFNVHSSTSSAFITNHPYYESRPNCILFQPEKCQLLQPWQPLVQWQGLHEHASSQWERVTPIQGFYYYEGQKWDVLIRIFTWFSSIATTLESRITSRAWYLGKPWASLIAALTIKNMESLDFLGCCPSYSWASNSWASGVNTLLLAHAWRILHQSVDATKFIDTYHETIDVSKDLVFVRLLEPFRAWTPCDYRSGLLTYELEISNFTPENSPDKLRF